MHAASIISLPFLSLTHGCEHWELLFLKILFKDNIFLTRGNISLNFFKKNCVEDDQRTHIFCDLQCLHGTLACKILQAGNMADTIDEALILLHLSAIQSHLCNEEHFNIASY